jgi:hypothetical protein
VGQPVASLLIPPDRQDEESNILAWLRRGERVDHYETVRMRKDGTLVDISLMISPVKDPKGRITGASKIAHDISPQALRKSNQALNQQLTADLCDDSDAAAQPACSADDFAQLLMKSSPQASKSRAPPVATSN